MSEPLAQAEVAASLMELIKFAEHGTLIGELSDRSVVDDHLGGAVRCAALVGAVSTYFDLDLLPSSPDEWADRVRYLRSALISVVDGWCARALCVEQEMLAI